MPPSVFLAIYFAALCNTAASLRWNGPPKSDSNSATSTANWSPATTADSRGGGDRRLRLEARARYPPNVCGWIGGLDSLPVTCSSYSSCAWNSDNNYVGCCATSNHACTFYTSCLDGNSPQQTAGDKSDVYTCKGTSVCYRNTYPNSYYQWGCGSSNFATIVATTFAIDGGSGPDALQIVITGNAPQANSPTVVSASTVTAEKTVLQTVTASAQPTPDPVTPKTNVASTVVDATTVTAEKTATQVVTASIETTSSLETPKTSSISTSKTSASKDSTGTSTGQSQSTASGAQEGSVTSTTSSSTTALPENSKSNKAAIIGGAVGGIALVLLILGAILIVWRRRKASEKMNAYAPAEQPVVWHL